MLKFGLVFLGGGVGSVFRFGVNQAATFLNLAGYWPTFFVNILGSFIAGVLVNFLPEQGRLLLITGFCGGLTTFSTFNLDNIQLQQNSQLGLLILNITITVAVSLFASFMGYKLGQGNI